jgi:hypothetical protein
MFLCVKVPRRGVGNARDEDWPPEQVATSGVVAAEARKIGIRSHAGNGGEAKLAKE